MTTRKTDVLDTDAIARILDETQSKARERCYTTADIQQEAEQAERALDGLEIPQRLRRGAVWTVGYQPFPASYNYLPQGTIIVLRRATAGWRLHNAFRGHCQGASKNGLRLAEDTRDWLKSQIDKKYS